MLTNNGPECSIDDDWSTWKNSVMYAMNEFVPTKCVDSRRIISIISKPLERCVLNHISHRIQSTIHSAQYGFVSGRSSTAQLLSTLQTIRKNLDKGLQTDVVFMDISKAFDTVDHAILLQKLRDFGISGSLLLWFENYLSGRFQRVTVLGATSTSLPITSGVSQGSLLAPFLFSLYINDLPNKT